LIDNLASARDEAGLPNDTIVIFDNVSFRHSVNIIEMLELREFTYKFILYGYRVHVCRMGETYVKRGLANTRALTQVDLENKMNAFRLSRELCCSLQYSRCVRVFDN